MTPHPWTRGDTVRRDVRTMPATVRAAVDLRLGPGVCYWCDYFDLPQPAGAVTLEHLQPLAQGGDNAASNLAWACEAHNKSRGSRRQPHALIPSRRGPR